MRRLFVLVALLAGGSALACERVLRVVEFLGWTAEANAFAWRVEESCVRCKPKWVTERTFLRTTSGALTEYVTRWDHPVYPRPEAPGKPEFDGWVKRFPLSRKAGAAKVTVKQGARELKASAAAGWCPADATPVAITLGERTRAFEPPSAACGCVRAFPSAGGEAVAFLTGPAKRACDDCEGAGCCAMPEGFAMTAD